MSNRKRRLICNLSLLVALFVIAFFWLVLIYNAEADKKIEVALQYLVAVGTVGAVLVALFIEPYKRWYYRPNIKISSFDFKNSFDFGKSSVYVNNNTYNGYADGYILRIVAKNEGFGWAEDVQMRIESIPAQGHVLAPVNLVWTNQHDKAEPYINRTTLAKMYLGLDYYCDLGVIIPPISNYMGIKEDTYLELMTGVKPANKSNRIKESSGPLKFRLVVFAKNFMPKSYILTVSYKQWSSVLSQMQSSNFLEVDIVPEK